MLQKNWTELIKPQQLDIQPGPDAATSASLVAEPLERGFGLTLGNALRRVLLSSLQGAAVTSIQIDGVLHEFSSVPGVREDVTELVLNVKAIALRMHAEGPKRVRLRADGPGPVVAGQIGDLLRRFHVCCHFHVESSYRGPGARIDAIHSGPVMIRPAIFRWPHDTC